MQKKILIAAASVSLFWAGSIAHAEIMAPVVGVTNTFDCSGPYGKKNTFKTASVKNGTVRTEQMRDGKAMWSEKPVAAIGTTLFSTRQLNDGKGVRHQSLDEDIVNEYARMVPGTKLEFNVRERHDEGRWEWGYKIEIGEPKTIEHEVLGKITVVPMTEKRKVWKGSYASTMTVLIAPDKGFSVAWAYKDPKGTMDCKLVGTN